MFDGLLRDTRFALRTFLKAPSFTAAVVATIALSIGATTAIFAVVDGVLVRPLPFPGSERVLRLCETSAAIGDWCGASPANVADWDKASARLEAAGVARMEGAVARIGNERFGVPGAIVSPGFFQVLGLKPFLGRLIEDRDMARGSHRVVLATHRFWRERLGGDRAAIGRPLALDDTGYILVGVLSADAFVPGAELSEAQIFRPLAASVDDVENRGWRGFTALGRMAPGVSQAALRAELDTIRAQLARTYPEANRDWGLRLVGLRESLVGDTRPTLLVFLGAVAFVLLIACANVASLLLVRATDRHVEFALRASLGAGRGRLVRQLVTEGLLLALAGGTLGVLLAAWITTAFVAAAPASIPRLREVAVDGRVIAFAFALAAAAALLFGLEPARRASRVDLNAALKGARGGAGGSARLRPAFVVGQLSLALVLLFGAALLARSFGRLMTWEPGFDRTNLTLAWMSAPERTTAAAAVAMAQVRDEVATIPGVRAAALGSGVPLYGGAETGTLAIEGRPALSPADMPTVRWFDVSPHYFETLGLRLVRGRSFSQADAAAAGNVAIVNETLARRFFSGESPIGRRVTVHDHASEIVGVVSDVRPLRPDQPTQPSVYWPIAQYPRLGAILLLRTSPGVAGVEKAVRARAEAVRAGTQLSRFFTLEERLQRELVSPRFNMLLVGGFALLAIVLAAVGVYGVIASSVASRTRELGIRIALGATPEGLVAHVVRQGLLLAALAIVAGCGGSFGVGRLLTAMLYGLPARDPLALGGAIALLTLVAVLACWLPARRASRVDPVVALRAQ